MSEGKSWEIPAEIHPPIEQAAILLNGAKNKKAARAFTDFVKSAAGREILMKFGFAVPVAAKS
jgi:molybdate transport system substrate-binding protein